VHSVISFPVKWVISFPVKWEVTRSVTGTNIISHYVINRRNYPIICATDLPHSILHSNIDTSCGSCQLYHRQHLTCWSNFTIIPAPITIHRKNEKLTPVCSFSAHLLQLQLWQEPTVYSILANIWQHAISSMIQIKNLNSKILIKEFPPRHRTRIKYDHTRFIIFTINIIYSLLTLSKTSKLFVFKEPQLPLSHSPYSKSLSKYGKRHLTLHFYNKRGANSTDQGWVQELNTYILLQSGLTKIHSAKSEKQLQQ